MTDHKGMGTALEKIHAAAAATDKIGDLVDKARQELERFDGRTINGWGVYADPSMQLMHLYDALKALNEAATIARAQSGAWPRSADYDRGEIEQTEEQRRRRE